MGTRLASFGSYLLCTKFRAMQPISRPRSVVAQVGTPQWLWLPRRVSASTKAATRRRYGWADDEAVFLHVGAMTTNKGIAEIGAALASAAAALFSSDSELSHPSQEQQQEQQEQQEQQQPARLRLVLKGHDGLYASRAHAEAALPAVLAALGDRVTVEYSGQSLPYAEVAALMQVRGSSRRCNARVRSAACGCLWLL